MATAGSADRLPDPATPYLRRGLFLWPPTAQACPVGHRRPNQRWQLGPDGPMEGPDSRSSAGLHYLGPLSGESRSYASTPIRPRIQREPSGWLRTADWAHRLRQLWSLPPGILPNPAQGLLQLRPAPPRGDRTDMLRTEGRGGRRPRKTTSTPRPGTRRPGVELSGHGRRPTRPRPPGQALETAAGTGEV